MNDERAEARAELLKTLGHKYVELPEEPTEDDIIDAKFDKMMAKRKLRIAKEELKKTQAKLLSERRYNGDNDKTASGVDL